MTAARVHALLAAGVWNPLLISRWRKDPTLIRRYGIDPASVDLAALQSFVGLTIKVRHNGVRRLLPMTFRLMARCGLEIEIFSAYALRVSENALQYGKTPEERATNLVHFLGQWLDLRKKMHILLWDLSRHEHAISRLGGPVPSESQSQNVFVEHVLTDMPTAATVPSIRGEVILHTTRCDPREVEALMLRNDAEKLGPHTKSIRLSTHHYCYWQSHPGVEIQLMELDPFGYYLLSSVDGSRSAGDLSRMLGGDRQPPLFFLNSLGELSSLGIVRL